MPLPIICLDAELRHFAEEFRSELSLPQWQHFVTVLLGLMLCEGASTLLGMLRQVADGASEAQLESISVLGAVGCRPWWQPNKNRKYKRVPRFEVARRQRW